MRSSLTRVYMVLLAGLFLVLAMSSVYANGVEMRGQPSVPISVNEQDLTGSVIGTVDVSAASAWRASRESGSSRIGSWSPTIAQFLQVYPGMILDIKATIPGADPRDIERIGVIFGHGKNMREFWENEKGKIEVDTSDYFFQTRIGTMLDPALVVEGKTGWRRLYIIVQVSKWKANQSHFSPFQFMLKESPKFRRLDEMTRTEMLNICSGLVPAFNVSDEIKYERARVPETEGAPGRLVVKMVDEQGQPCDGTIIVEDSKGGKSFKNEIASRDGQIFLNGNSANQREAFLSAPIEAGTTLWACPKGGIMSKLVTVYPGQEITFSFKRVKVSSGAVAFNAPVVAKSSWRNLGGNPRAAGAIKCDADAINWFVSSAGTNDMKRLGLSPKEIENVTTAVKANGVTTMEVKGQVFPSGLTFGDSGELMTGPVSAELDNVRSATGYFPTGITGRIPVVVGQAVGHNGQPIAGCSNMVYQIIQPKIATSYTWVDISPTPPAPPIAVEAPEEFVNVPFGYLGSEAPTYVTRERTVGTITVVPTANIDSRSYATGGNATANALAQQSQLQQQEQEQNQDQDQQQQQDIQITP